MNVLKKVRFAARLAVFMAILLGALSSAIVAPTPAQADRGNQEPTLILLFGAEESLQEAGEVIGQQIETVELFRSYPSEYLQEFPNGEESEAGHLYRLIGDGSFDDVVEQLQAIIERNRIQDVAIEAENLAPLFYVPGEILLTGPEGELEEIARKYGLELIGEKITISRERTKSQQGAQNLQFGAYQIAEGTVQEIVTSINNMKYNVSSSPNLLTTQGVGYYVNCGGWISDSCEKDPPIDWGSVYPAISASVEQHYTGKGVLIAVLDNVHSSLENTSPVGDVVGKYVCGTDECVGINVWQGGSWPRLPTSATPSGFEPIHGMFVAGLAHAMAPDAEIHLLPVLNEDGFGTVATLTYAINAFTNKIMTKPPTNGAVINLSLTIEASRLPLGIVGIATPALDQAIANAHAANISIVAAAGNDFQNSVSYLATDYPDIISVGASYRHEMSCFSNLGMVYAPGGGGGSPDAGNPSTTDCFDDEYVVSEDQDVKLRLKSCSLSGPNRDNCVRSWIRYENEWVIGVGAGTSFSTPQVAGLAALHLQKESWDTPFQVRTAILNGATGSAYITPSQCGMNMQSCGIMNAQNTLGIPIGPPPKGP